MKLRCPNKACLNQNSSPALSQIVRKGRFYRKSDSRWIKIFKCSQCQKYFSEATRSACVYQKRRRLNHRVQTLLCSGVSQRRTAILLKANRKTIVRSFRFSAEQARIELQSWKIKLRNSPISEVQFDDLETSEHSKYQPLSVALAVDAKYRKILDFQISEMPAKGRASKLSIKKYGGRKDLRKVGWKNLMENLKLLTTGETVFTSDENPHYSRFFKKYFPKNVHNQVKGQRGCSTGQGELKKIGFDPLFSLNHTCAMLRANMNRLFRKTWCTTKNKKGLLDHLAIYVQYHNKVLTQRLHPWHRNGLKLDTQKI